MKPGSGARLALIVALLLLAYGSAVALLGRHLAREHEQESLQRLSHGLARHIVEHWPEVAGSGASEQATKMALMNMLMVVNPGIEVYLLDADGRVAGYVGDPADVRQAGVDLDAVRHFLAGGPLPLYGTDPKAAGGGPRKLFSAAMFPPKTGDVRPPGYLYVVLEGQMRTQTAAPLGVQSAWVTAAWVAALALLALLALGALLMRRLAQAEQAAAHREVMANVAHDLRTPLTALHGHLEALRAADTTRRDRLLDTALAQSDKVRRLTQQLFELATLQATDQLPHPERFRLDELVVDTVQKFELAAAVELAGPPPGRVEVNGDLQLIERALTNLIDNAVRHGGGSGPVKVAIDASQGSAQVVIEDAGPGLPQALFERLAEGRPVREPALRRPGGGLGGLGLAIAQRVARLHGGALRPLPPSAGGGTRLALRLPMA
jgi:signal transduction histidine kinase